MKKEFKIKQIVQWGKYLVCLGQDGLLYYISDVDSGVWNRFKVEKIIERKIKEIRIG